MAKNIFGFEDDNNNDPKRNQKKKQNPDRKKKPDPKGMDNLKFDQIPRAENPTDIQNILRTGYKGDVNVVLNSLVVKALLDANGRNRSCSDPSKNMLLHSYLTTGYVPVGKMSMYQDGLLADGQHRLSALEAMYKSGKRFKDGPPVQSFRFGLTEAQGMDIDNGRIPSASDALRIKGVIKNKKYSSAIHMAILRDEYLQTGKSPRRKTSAREQEEVWNNGFCAIRELGSFTGMPSPMGAKRSPAAWVVLAFKLIQDEWGTEMAKKAKDQFYKGDNVKDYMVALRNYLVANPGKFKVRAGTKEIEDLIGMVFYCFNHFMFSKRPPKTPLIEGKKESLINNPNKK